MHQFRANKKKTRYFLLSVYTREQIDINLTYPLKLIPAQAWHVDRTPPTPKSDQTLPSKVLYHGDVEAHREDSHVPIAKAF